MQTQAVLHGAKIKPLCEFFEQCGGCSYQDLPYEEELQIKEEQLRTLFADLLPPDKIDAIIGSPESYYYRHRLDLTLKRTRAGLLFGFQSEGSKKMISLESCVIAKQTVCDFLPDLKQKATEKLPPDYRTANLVVKTSDDGRVFWGGIGRRSLELAAEDYLWTEIFGRRIFYSLNTFFQANLSILPLLIQKIKQLAQIDAGTLFLDLYAGVGLFGLCFADSAVQIAFIEDTPASVKLLRHNLKYHQIRNAEVYQGRVEDYLIPLLEKTKGMKRVAIVDPPRKGLHTSVLEVLSGACGLDRLFYLSCNPEALRRDLQVFVDKGWEIVCLIPFDFFPRTRHLETLALLKPVESRR